MSPLHESPSLEIHVTHGGDIVLLFLRYIGDENFSSKYHTSNAGSILQGCARNFGWIDNTGLDHIGEFFFRSVPTDAGLFFLNLLDDDGTFGTGVVGDLAQGRNDRLVLRSSHRPLRRLRAPAFQSPE